MRIIKLIEIEQPIGSFYMGKMKARDLIGIKSIKRLFDGDGVQRLLNNQRVNDISIFCTDPDATFPTPIIIAVTSEYMKLLYSSDDGSYIEVQYDENTRFAEVLDGQHRIEGIERAALSDSSLYEMEIPIIVMFDLNDAQKAYIFSTINGNQAPVNQSLIYELTELSQYRSPDKTCHEIARALNSNEQSPFYRRLKMLEKRKYNTESITQNAFVTNLCKLISKNPQSDAIAIKKNRSLEDNYELAFRKYFIREKDAVILKILINYFTAFKKEFPEEWEDTNRYILTKTVGFSGMMQALNELVPIGESRRQLSEQFFLRIAKQFKVDLHKSGKWLIIDDFQTSGKGSALLAKMIVNAAKELV